MATSRLLVLGECRGLPKILIITEADDFHAIAGAEALVRKGAEVVLWATSDFPTCAEESAYFSQAGVKTVMLQGIDLDLLNPHFEVVWRRRPTYVLNTDTLHPADRSFADNECSMFRRSFFYLLAPGAFWVNPLEGAARAGSKLLQHEAAGIVGLRMPTTLFSNSPSEIRRFLAQNGGAVVYKKLSAAGWRNKKRHFLTYTALVTPENLVPDEVLRQTPGIFQEVVPKEYELRVTVMGKRVFAAKIFSQQTMAGKLDWRRAYDELRFEPTHLPPELEHQCVALLAELGLVFGCFDFIVTPGGQHVFLEVNEMGQFLFIERYCGLPLLDAFSEFLLQGSVDFDWSEESVAVRYTDPEFEAAAKSKSDEFLSRHVPRPGSLVNER